MNLVKTSFLSLIATIAKMLSGLVINKMVAIWVGPAGLAIVGQFQNFVQMTLSIATGGIGAGVTKLTAEFHGQPKQSSIFSASLKITMLFSVISGLIVLVFSSQFSNFVLHNDAYSSVFRVFGLTLVLFSLNQLLLSILNGLGEVKRFIAINIAQSFISLILTVVLVLVDGLRGALYALAVSQSVVFIVALVWIKNSALSKTLFNFKSTVSDEYISLFKFSLMTLTSAILVPASHFYIRKHIGETLSWQDAGNWQGIWYISTMYLMVFTMSLSTYFLPKLSKLSDKHDIRKELARGYALILPLVLISAVGIYVLRDFIIEVLFSSEFHGMSELFLFQLIGDFLKMAAWLVAYLMITKSMTRIFIVSEVVFNGLFVLLSALFVNGYGLLGVTYAYALNFLFYTLFSAWVTRRYWL